jgi:hypothetical protein
MFSADKTWEGIEKCLITARRLGANDDRIVPLLYECALEPFFLGDTENLTFLGFLAELLEEFGWDQAEELVCNLAAKILGRERGAPEELRMAAIKMFEPVNALIEELASTSPAGPAATYDEDALAKALVSGNLAQTFDAISSALRARVEIHRIVSTMVLLAADRMARTPVNLNPGWGSLRQELILASLPICFSFFKRLRSSATRDSYFAPHSRSRVLQSCYNSARLCLWPNIAPH